jgi:hypothetical protein
MLYSAVTLCWPLGVLVLIILVTGVCGWLDDPNRYLTWTNWKG